MLKLGYSERWVVLSHAAARSGVFAFFKPPPFDSRPSASKPSPCLTHAIVLNTGYRKPQPNLVTISGTC